jgi:hypothetical protein
MKYLQLIRVAPGVQPEPGDTDPEPWARETTARGTRVTGDRLFAEARERVAGYNIIRAPSLDDAIEIAAAHPASHIGPIELRPLWPM